MRRTLAGTACLAFSCCALMARPVPPQQAPSGKGASESQKRTPGPPTIPHSVNQAIERARDLIGAGEIDQAIALLRQALEMDPSSLEVHLLLGTALALKPERSEALRVLRKAAELEPESASAFMTLGTALARFAELDAARRAFEKAVALDPESADSRVNLALVLAQQGEYGGARKHLTEAISLLGESPQAAYAHYLLARVFAGQKQPSRAAAELERAVKLRSDYAEAYLNLGMMRRELDDNAGALQAFQRAVKLSPENPEAQRHLGAAYLRLDKLPQAIEHLRKANQMNPDDRPALYQLCQALRRAGRTEEASECRDRLSAMIQTRTAAKEHILEASKANNEGVELEKEGNLTSALERYHAAIELDPLQTIYRRNLALVLCRLGRWEEGVAELREVLDMDPDDAQATKALYIALERSRKARKTGSTSHADQPGPR